MKPLDTDPVSPPIADQPDQATPSAQPQSAASPVLFSWFRRWSIERRVLVGFSLVFVGIVVIGAVSYRNTMVLIENSRQDTNSHELVQLLDGLVAALDDAESGHRRYLVTGEDVYLKPYEAVQDRLPQYLRYATVLSGRSQTQQARMDRLGELIRQQLDAEAAAIAQRREQGYDAVRQLALSGAAKQVADSIHQTVAELQSEERRALQRRVAESTASTRNTILLLGLGTLLQLALLGSVYYLIRHDVTERRRVAAELQRRGELLQAANKELEAFSYSVSHDLRAPLRHIDGYTALLAKSAGDSLNEKAQRYLQTISASATQMGQLIDDLLVFSRMGRQEMLQTRVNLDQLVKTILQDLRLDLQGRSISWTIGALPEVQGDPAMLRQVFSNLIANAIKFTATRAMAKIEIGCDSSSPDEVVIFVRDNGVGFDMQYASKLFGVFQRLHRAEEFEGTGIGLANVRRIVHRHGGRTWAEGTLDHGATFYVGLPRKKVSA